MFVAWAVDCPILAWIGQGSMTLGILCLHKFPILVMERLPFVQHLYHQGLGVSIALDFLIAAIAVVVSVAITMLIVKTAPWMLGRRQ